MPRTFTTRTLNALPADLGVNCSLALDHRQTPLLSCWQDLETPNPKLVLLTVARNPDGAQLAPVAVEAIRAVRGSGSALAVQALPANTANGPKASSRPWVAYYDLDAGTVNVAHREGSDWVVDLVEDRVGNFAPAGLGIAMGSDGQPRICYSSSSGLSFATRSAKTSGWQRDTLSGAHWSRPVIREGKLTPGFDAGVFSAPNPEVMTLSSVDGALQLAFRPQPGAANASGAVFITFGPVQPPAGQAGMDVGAYVSLVVEMRGDAGKTVMLGVKSANLPDHPPEARIALTLNETWTTYTVPLAKFPASVDLTQLYFAADFAFAGTQPITAFVRSVAFSDKVVPGIEQGRQEPVRAPPPLRRDILRGPATVPGFGPPDVGPAGVNTRFQGADPASHSYRMAFPQGPAFVVLRPAAGTASVDLSAFETLLVEMRGEGTIGIGIRDKNQVPGSERKLPLRLASEWRTYAIPLSAFQAVDVPNLAQLFVVAEFVKGAGPPVTAFVRSIRYSSVPAHRIAPPLGDAVLAGKAAVHASLALDARDQPHISYFDLDDRKLRVASRQEQIQVARDGAQSRVTQWVVTEIPSSEAFGGEFTSIKVDGQGTVHLAFWTLDGPRYARLQGQHPVVVEKIASDVGAGMYVSLDVKSMPGGACEPQVVYYQPSGAAGGFGQLKAVQRTANTWGKPEVVDRAGDVGEFASLALNTLGQPVIGYRDATNRRLKLATMAED